ncbi:hypothetical protein Gogos_010086, partial [Gossypium gossypioides]|nr:hypothetical protein [Gossypium gossypioides]
EDEDPLQIPLVTANFWVQVHDLPPGFFSELVAKHFCLARLDNEGKEMDLGWDLSLRAQSRRVVVVNSIWLREEEDNGFFGVNLERQNVTPYTQLDCRTRAIGCYNS